MSKSAPSLDAVVQWAKEHKIELAVGAGVVVSALLARKVFGGAASTVKTSSSSSTTSSTSTAASSSGGAAAATPSSSSSAADGKGGESGPALSAKNAGNDAFHNKKYKEAVDLYSQAIALYDSAKDRAICYCNRAASHLQLKNYDEVVKDCTESLKLDPEYIKAFHRRAQAYEQLHRLPEALYDYTAVCILKKFADREAMQTVDRVLKQLGEGLAQDFIKTRTPVLPGKSTIHMYLESFHSLGTETLPREQLTAMIANDPSSGELYLRRALAVLHAEDYEHVLEDATKAASLLQEKIDKDAECDRASVQALLVQALEVEGSFHHLLCQPAQSLACFDKILALNPDHTNALLRRATTLLEQGRLDNAIESLQVAVRSAPKDFYARYHYAQSSLVKEDLPAALEEFDRCVKLSPTFAAPYIQLGLCQLKVQGPDVAHATFKNALHLFPNTADVYTYYAQMLIQIQDIGEAVKLLTQAEEKTAHSPLPAFFHAQVKLQLGDLAGGMEMLERALKKDAHFDAAYQQLAQIALQRKDLDRALALFEKVISCARTLDDLTTAFSCREAALAQQHVLAEYPKLRTIVDSL